MRPASADSARNDGGGFSGHGELPCESLISDMFMISWYALISRLRTSLRARNDTLAFCISSITWGSSTPGVPRSKASASCPGALLLLVHLVDARNA